MTIGRYWALNPAAAVFHGGGHRLDWVSVANQQWERGMVSAPGGAPTSRGPVVIGGDVWVGYEALIMSGGTIGDGAVVGARAVVTRDVAPFETVGGNPARHIRWRFDEPTRQALLRINW